MYEINTFYVEINKYKKNIVKPYCSKFIKMRHISLKDELAIFKNTYENCFLISYLLSGVYNVII